MRARQQASMLHPLAHGVDGLTIHEAQLGEHHLIQARRRWDLREFWALLAGLVQQESSMAKEYKGMRGGDARYLPFPLLIVLAVAVGIPIAAGIGLLYVGLVCALEVLLHRSRYHTTVEFSQRAVRMSQGRGQRSLAVDALLGFGVREVPTPAQLHFGVEVKEKDNFPELLPLLLRTQEEAEYLALLLNGCLGWAHSPPESPRLA